MFWFFTILIFLVALALPLLRLFVSTKDDNVNVSELNLSLHHDRLNELKTELELGMLTDVEFAEAKQELATALAGDLSASELPRATQSKQNTNIAMVAIVVLVSAAISYGLYKRLASEIYFTTVQPGENSEHAIDAYNALPGIATEISNDVFNAELWYKMGQQYSLMLAPTQALQAYTRAIELGIDENVDLYMELFNIHIKMNQGAITADAEVYLDAAFKLEPTNAKVLVAKGFVAFQKRDYDTAIRYIRRARQEVIDAPEKYAGIDAQQLDGVIEIIEQRRAGVPAPSQPQSPHTAPQAIASINIQASIDPELLSKVSPDDIVFVIAKADNGPPAPLAVKALYVKDLPINVSLSDADAMVEGMNMSRFDKVNITVRVSRTGKPVAEPGDVYGEFGPINPKEYKEPISITINKIVE